MWRALSSPGGWELGVPALVRWAVPGMGGGSPVVARTVLVPWLVTSILGERLTAFTFYRSI